MNKSEYGNCIYYSDKGRLRQVDWTNDKGKITKRFHFSPSEYRFKHSILENNKEVVDVFYPIILIQSQ